MFTQLARRAPASSGVFDARSGEFYPYARLDEQAEEVSARLASRVKRLVLLLCDNSIASLIGYLAALRAGHAVMLASPASDASHTRRYLASYRPEWVLSPATADVALGDGYRAALPAYGLRIEAALEPTESSIHPELAILLLTSGSTGSPKAVRLSYSNIASNATAIAEYLRIQDTEVAVTSLPPSYSYGLSVLNSHLQARASLVLTNSSVTTAGFWDVFRSRNCTSLAGVPFTYEVLERLRFTTWALPSLRTLTQAGGRLPEARTRAFAAWAARAGVDFFVMYGQTEASPRISYVPPDILLDKIGAIGIPIPGGHLSISAGSGGDDTVGAQGELIYRGPNVMLGYAHSRDDLVRGDELKGVLCTGDLGRVDDDGCFYVTGRLSRFLKLFGLRIGLDEVEALVEAFAGCPVACIGDDQNLVVVLASSTEPDTEAIRRYVSERCALHASVVRVRHVDTMPAYESGKKDYAAIRQRFG